MREKENKVIFKSWKTELTGRVLIGMLLVLLCFLFYQKKVEAAEGEVLVFDEQGNLKMTTHDRIATNNVTYKTIGWTIKRYDLPMDAPGNQCVTILIEDDGEPMTDPADAQYKYSYFKCDKETIFNRIGAVSTEWQQELYTNGGIVFLDAVMTVCENGVAQGGLSDYGDSSWGEVYYTFGGISEARAWADPDVLISHFDKQVYFCGNPTLLNLTCTYDIQQYECFDTHAEMWSLSRYGKDRSGEIAEGGELSVLPEDFSAYDFIYISAHIVKLYRDGSMSDEWTEAYPIIIQNNDGSLGYVRIELYYKRKGFVEYLSDSFHMDGDSVLVEGNISIGAGTKEAQSFDVSKGVPTGKELYIEGSLNNFGYKVKYANYHGWRTKKVRLVSVYQCYWNDVAGNARTMQYIVPENYYVDRTYSYWKIEEIEIYTLKEVTVYNYAFEDEQARLENLYSPNIVLEQITEHVREVTEEYWIDGGALYGEGVQPVFPVGVRQAEANLYATDFMVQNDTFSIDEEVFLGGNEPEESAGAPKTGSVSGKTDFYREGLNIPAEKRNGKDYVSSAQLVYDKYSTHTEEKKSFEAVNTVTLHTPVRCYAYATDEKNYNQLCQPDKERKTWILGRNFEIRLSAYGKHLEQQGYGVRDYQEYVGRYQVQFPFPVYYKNTYYEENVWIDCTTGADLITEMDFYLPTGVLEGNYTVKIRSLAYNYQDGDLVSSDSANMEVEQYGAYQELQVAVCGRLYGMKITDIDKESWKSVFYNVDGSVRGNTYTIGLYNENGELVRKDAMATFPILQGGHPDKEEYEGESLGISFSFALESVGDYKDTDGIYIEPEYYVTDKDGKNRRKVDVYHFYEESGGKKWLNIKRKRESGIQYLTGATRINTGSEDRNVKDIQTALRSVQQWKGSFCVPADIYVVSAGTDVEKYIKERGNIKVADEIFINEGYLMVQFQVYTMKDGRKYLSYINEINAKDGYANMWKIEGFTNPKQRKDKSVFAIKYGDVFLYDLQKYKKDSHEIMGTH